MKFTGNRALIGSAVYANRVDLCSWYSFETPYFYTDTSDVLRWPFISYRYTLSVFDKDHNYRVTLYAVMKKEETLTLILVIMWRLHQTNHWLYRHQLLIL